MKTIKLVIGIIFLCYSAMAQHRLIRKGDRKREKDQLKQALEYYQKAESKNKDPELAKIRIASTYFDLKDFTKSLEYYKKSEQDKMAGKELFRFASLQLRSEKYGEAQKLFQQARDKNFKHPLLQTKINSCQWAAKNSDETDQYQVNTTNIKITEQTEGIQFFEKNIVYATELNNSGSMDLFLATYNNGSAGEPQNFSKEMNTSNHHETAISFTGDKLTAFFSRKDKNDKGLTKIYMASYDGFKWTEIKSLPFNGSNYSCKHPSVTSDGKKIYFSSDVKGGKGGYDIYFSEKNGDSWSKPQNIESINTAGDELYPHIDEDDKMFFASNGHTGYGGLDIFYALLWKNKWTNVTNLRKPVNSSANDYAFHQNPENTEYAIFISDRNNKYSAFRSRRTQKYELRFMPDDSDQELKTEYEGVGRVIYPDDEDYDVETILEKNNPSLKKKTGKNNDIYENIVYKVQFESSVKPLDKLPIIDGYYAFRYFYKGLYRYTVGSFKTVEPADKLKEKARQMGYHDAFVVAFKKGERVLVPIYNKKN